MKTVFLFPGQGSQKPGMGKDFFDNSQKVKEFFYNISDLFNKDIPSLLFNSSVEDLQKTENTQIAISVINIATALVLQEHGIIPDAVAGFSLGEYAALVLAQVVSQEDMFRMVVQRGKIMEKTNKQQEQQFSGTDSGNLGMTAMLGIHPNSICEIITEKSIDHVYVSMYNSPVQGVISGPLKAREQLSADLVNEKKAKRSVPLRVGGAFHTPFMKDARIQFEKVIRDIPFKDPSIPIYSNVTGKIVSTGIELKTLYLDQLVNPVIWIAEEDAIWDDIQPSRVLEVGTGTVLSGLWKQWKISKNNDSIVDVISIDSFEKIHAL